VPAPPGQSKAGGDAVRAVLPALRDRRWPPWYHSPGAPHHRTPGFLRVTQVALGLVVLNIVSGAAVRLSDSGLRLPRLAHLLEAPPHTRRSRSIRPSNSRTGWS